MEDWAYSGSWDNYETVSKPVKVCSPNTFGGYPREKTIYDKYSIRSMIYLVEASFYKKPPEDSLGTDDNLFINRKDILLLISRSVYWTYK
jgi:hypothetical protein